MVATGAVAVVAVPIGSSSALPTSVVATRPASRASSTSTISVHVHAVATAELTDLARVGAEDGRPAQLTALTGGADAPACAPPAMPAPTYPPGNGYGVPFLAEITGGQVLAGYDEWTANHLKWRAGGTTYNLYPWQSKIFDITGWVTGLLQLPSLSASIPPQDIVFCDGGGASCLAASWPAGECIHILAQYGPSPASSTPPPALGNEHPEGTACQGYSTPTFACFPYVVSLTPDGNTTLTVSGVESDGALDLEVSTEAVTTVSEISPPAPTMTCQNQPTAVTLSTTLPAALPSTAPVAPDPPNTDDRGLQTLPQALTGPLASGTSTVASNNFFIPSFFPDGGACTSFLAESLNTYAGGWSSSFKDQGEGLYYLEGGTGADAVQPGWAQFTATTTVVSLDVPVGPPADFNF
jgi:hypothetical protein